jgi:hypothetical protein
MSDPKQCDKYGGPCQNTDRELFRETEGDYYAPSLHVTQSGGIGINVGGTVYVKPLREWHKLAGGMVGLSTPSATEPTRPFGCKCGANTPAECQKPEEECDGMWGPLTPSSSTVTITKDDLGWHRFQCPHCDGHVAAAKEFFGVPSATAPFFCDAWTRRAWKCDSQCDKCFRMAAPQWIEVSDKLPPLQELVLAIDADGQYALAVRACEPNERHSHWLTHRSDEIVRWQFLPDAKRGASDGRTTEAK